MSAGGRSQLVTLIATHFPSARQSSPSLKPTFQPTTRENRASGSGKVEAWNQLRFRIVVGTPVVSPTAAPRRQPANLCYNYSFFGLTEKK